MPQNSNKLKSKWVIFQILWHSQNKLTLVKAFLKSSGFKKSRCVLCVGATAERVTSDGPTKPVPLIFYAFFPELTDTDG